MRRILVALGIAGLGGPAVARAQVGYQPEKSPYRDTEGHSDFYLQTGYFSSAKDAAGVGPRSGPLVGLRYDVLFGNTPIFFVTRFTHVFAARTVIDPTQPVASRVLQTKASAPFNIADVGLGLQLTGQKTFHGFIPVINVGGGLASDLGGTGGPGHYHFGTQLALTAGGGIRWVPGGRLTLRADANTYLYPHHYPATYHTITGDGTQVLPSTHKLTAWRTNGAFTLGVWYAFLR